MCEPCPLALALGQPPSSRAYRAAGAPWCRRVYYTIVGALPRVVPYCTPKALPPPSAQVPRGLEPFDESAAVPGVRGPVTALQPVPAAAIARVAHGPL